MTREIDRRKSFDRRQESIALKHSEEQYRRLFETTQDGILIVRVFTGEITDANPYLLNIFGYSREDVIGKKIRELGVIQDGSESREDFNRLQEQGFIRYNNLPVRTKDGRNIFVELIGNVYEIWGEKIIQCNIRDVTGRKLAEEEREKLIGELQDALANIKKLSGLIPICASCKSIRDDEGYWRQLEQYISEHSEANFTHGICPECMTKLYPKQGRTGRESFLEEDRPQHQSPETI